MTTAAPMVRVFISFRVFTAGWKPAPVQARILLLPEPPKTEQEQIGVNVFNFFFITDDKT
jgi:hypothetical protein